MTTVEDRRAAIIGAGLIGRSWAMIFAAAGWNVRITDSSSDTLSAAPGLIEQGLAELTRHGLVENAKAATARIAIAGDLPGAVSGASFIQECGPETLESKRALFAQLDSESLPEAIIASSSSGLSASQYTESLAGRQRCLVAHPVNPPHLVPVVEICASPWTTSDVIERAKSVYAEIGQVPVMLHAEVDGFVLNRLQGALLAEALRLVGQGVISPQDLDRTVKDGLGLRWSFMGPFETIDLNAPGGMADYCRRYTGLYRRISEDPAPPEVWDPENIACVLDAWGASLEGDARVRRSAWRDARLAALRAHKSAVAAAE